MTRPFLGFALFMLGILATGCPQPLHTINGELGFGDFGRSVAVLSDVDGDLVPDIVVGAVSFGTNFRVHSGLDATEIYNQASGSSGAGGAVSGSPDIDGDAFPDIVVGASPFFTASNVDVWRGNEREIVFSISDVAGAHLGADVSGFTDLDGDDRAEFLAGADLHDGPAGADAGRAVVFAGADASEFLSIDGEAAGDRFGASITDVPDVDTDGVLDFAVGAPGHDGPAGADAGRVYVYSGATGAFLRAIDGVAAGGQLGRTLEDCGDVDGDGAGDLIAGGIGSATVISGADGSVLFAFANGFSEFGRAVDGAGDFDGDAVPDLVVGGKEEAFVFSGASGDTIVRLFSFNVDSVLGFQTFGTSVAGLGDLNGDGRSEVIVGAPRHYGFANPDFGSPDGAAYVFSALTLGL